MTNKERDEEIIKIFQECAENTAKCIGIGGLAGAVVHASYYARALASLRNVLMVKPKSVKNEDAIKVHIITFESTMTEDERCEAYTNALIRAAADAGFTLEKA